MPEDGNGVPPSEQATRQREGARVSSNHESPPVTPDRAVQNRAESSARRVGDQRASDGSPAPSSVQLRASEPASQFSPTAVERTPDESRDGNTAESTSVDNSATSPAVQNRQSASSVSIQQGPVNEMSVASIHEVSDVSTPRVPTAVRPIDVPAVSSISSPTASATSTAPARSDIVREPAVPMGIQDAVSAIQDATSGDSHIRVRLNPRELGNMLVDVSRTENGIVARLEVESAAARVAVLETLPDLQQSLARSGASVDRVEVVLTETRADSGRQESDQSQQRDQQQSRQDRQSSDQRQARDEQNQRREQNQRHDQRDDTSSIVEESNDGEATEQLDIKL